MRACHHALQAILLIGAALLAFPAGAMSYRLAEFDDGRCQPKCPSVIVATGHIAGNEDEEFAWFMRHSGQGKRVGKLVLIHSPGGNMAGGMRLGTLLRKNGASVMVAQGQGETLSREGGLMNGLCGSACVFVLAGGVKRIVPQGSIVAVHSAAQVQTEFHDRMTNTVQSLKADKHQVTALMADYYRRMGVKPELARLSEQIPHEDVRILTGAEASRLRLSSSRF